MWTKTRSLFLSRMLTVAAFAAAIILAFFIPAMSRWYDEFSDVIGLIGGSIFLPTCITLYFCDCMALWLLGSLHRLLSNINSERVFVPENTACLRSISWGCMFVGFALLILGLWRFIFLFCGIVAITFGLIMRVLKNVFEKAVEIKSENDFTI